MDSSEEIKSRYASEAKTYREDALIINFDAPNLFKEFIKIIKTFYPDTKKKYKILDIGAGNGMLTELVFKDYKSSEYTMFDFSSSMLESSKYIFEEENLSINVNRVVGNFITDNLPKGKYDLIISSYALHHIRSTSELKKVYENIKASLTDTGLFICLDNYLGKTDEERKYQITTSLNKWSESYNSKDKALEWGTILETEDSPATIKTIISIISSINVLPLLTPAPGVLATIYGFTKLDESSVKLLKLEDLINSWKNSGLVTNDEREYLISNYQYTNEKEDRYENI